MNIIFIEYYGQHLNLSEIQITTLMYYMLIGVSVLAVIKACLPLNPLRIFLMLTTSVGIYVAAMLFHGLLEITLLDATTFPIFAVLFVVTAITTIIIHSLQNHIKKLD